MNTGDRFRILLREVLGLAWDSSDAALFAEIKRLKEADDRSWRSSEQQRRLAAAAYTRKLQDV